MIFNGLVTFRKQQTIQPYKIVISHRGNIIHNYLIRFFRNIIPVLIILAAFLYCVDMMFVYTRIYVFTFNVIKQFIVQLIEHWLYYFVILTFNFFILVYVFIVFFFRRFQIIKRLLT